MKVIKEVFYNIPTDILIIDPCCFNNSNIWDGDSDYLGEGITGLVHTTYIGDRDCTVYQTKRNKHPTKYSKKLGKFYADSGNVCVADTEGILRHNPNFIKDWQSRDLNSFNLCVTQINNFVGKVQFRVYTDNKRKYWKDRLVLRGIGNINFESVEGFI